MNDEIDVRWYEIDIRWCCVCDVGFRVARFFVKRFVGDEYGRYFENFFCCV